MRGGKGRGGGGRDITAESVKARRFCGGTRRSDRRFRLHLIAGKCNAVVKWVRDRRYTHGITISVSPVRSPVPQQRSVWRGERESSVLSDLAGERFRWGFRAQIIADLLRRADLSSGVVSVRGAATGLRWLRRPERGQVVGEPAWLKGRHLRGVSVEGAEVS